MRLVCLFLILIICLFPAVVFSYDISLSWDKSSDDDVDGYKVFMRTEGHDYDYNSPVFEGTALNCLINGLDYEEQYFFVARSFREIDNETIESDNSNEIGYRRSTPVPVEEPPVDEGGQDSGLPDNPDSETVSDNEVTSEGSNPDVNTGTDDTVFIKNIATYQPVLISPENGIIQATVTPALKVSAYSDSSTDNVHSSTEWQISSNDDFSSLIFKKTSQSSLTSLNVPQLILNDNTTYFWRVRFFDNANTASQWSASWEFQTVMTYTEDEDQDGVPDDLEVDENVDLDYNGIPDINQNDIKCMNTTTGDSQVGVGIESGEAVIDMIQSIDWDLIGDAANRPKKMPMNLIGFRLLVETGAEVEVVIYFSEKLPRSAKWFKHDVQNGWQDFSDHTVFSTTEDGRTKVTFYLKDGGFGDEDGVANGVIIDPSGPGFMSLEENVTEMIDTTEISNAGDGSGGGCFIGTGGFNQAASAPTFLYAFFFLTALSGLVRLVRE